VLVVLGLPPVPGARIRVNVGTLHAGEATGWSLPGRADLCGALQR
jgi:hypothetical protein